MLGVDAGGMARYHGRSVEEDGVGVVGSGGCSGEEEVSFSEGSGMAVDSVC